MIYKGQGLNGFLDIQCFLIDIHFIRSFPIGHIHKINHLGLSPLVSSHDLIDLKDVLGQASKDVVVLGYLDEAFLIFFVDVVHSQILAELLLDHHYLRREF